MTGKNTPRFALPGTWGRISLSTEANVQSSIRKVVEYGVGRDDRFATVRADLRARFREAAEIARTNGAVDFHIAFQIAPGVPLPAWLSVFLPSVESTDFEALGLSDLKRVLQFGLTAAEDGVAKATTTLTTTDIHAVRQAFRRVRPATEDEPELETLQVDYWLAAAEPARLALLSFTTHYVDFETQMLDLFDAAIGTVRWPAPAPTLATT